MRHAVLLRAILAALVWVAAKDAAAALTTVVPLDATWRYHAQGQNLGTAWRPSGYDDAAWPGGPAKLGFGDPGLATTVPGGPSNARYPTIYFRTSFTLAALPTTLTALTLRADYDDGFVAYLNGVEIARRGITANPVVYGALATLHESGSLETIDVTSFASLLAVGTNVVAVEVHQASATSSDLAWRADLCMTTGDPGVVRGPYLQLPADGAVTVRWRTDAPTDSRVRYGIAPGALVSVVSDATPKTEHELRLTGLVPGVRVYYAVGSSAGDLAGDDAQTWYEPPLLAAPRLRAWILGDSGYGNLAQSNVRDAYLTHTGDTPTDVWLMLGDNAYGAGTDGEYQAAVFDPFATLLRRVPLWPTRGNHDQLYSGASNDYYDAFSLPAAGEAGGLPSSSEAWYSFDRGDVHFVCLDSEGSDRTPGGAMLTWLAADLAATDRKWIVAFFHHPPYTKGSHDSNDPADSGGRMRDMRQNALPILEAYGADLVLCGHSHSYERSFLLDGHYGTSGTLTPQMVEDGGDGRPDGDGAYVKPAGPAPHRGALYAVAGSSAQISGGTLDHPVMIASLNVLGSLVLDVSADTLDGRFLDDQGEVRDSFRIVKPVVVAVGDPAQATPDLALRLGGPNPSSGPVALAYDLPRAGRARLELLDVKGRRLKTLESGALAQGRGTAAWDGNDDTGRRVPPGVYFAVLRFEGARRVARIVVDR